MINPKLHLQAPKGSIDGEFPILLLFSVNKKRIQYYTQVRMPKKYFISAKGSKYPFNNRWPMAAAAKIKLDALIRHAYSIESDFIKSGIEQNIDLYREELDKRYKGRIETIAESTESIEDRIKEYLEHVKKNLAHNTFRNTQTNLNHLRNFFGKKATKTRLNELTEDVIEDYHDFLKNDRMNNSVVKAMNILRTFLGYCFKKKYILEIPAMDFGRENNITVIHLTYEEVMKIAYTPMPSIALDRVKDFFLLGCFTGMRYADIAGLKKNNYSNDSIKFFNSKNGETQTITIPLTEVSNNILQKYKDSNSIYAVPSISNQKTNDALKIVAEFSNINSQIEIARKNGFGKIEKTIEQKNKLITCHTSRKSFITIAMTLGMKEATIKSITGHAKGSKAFHKYYDVVDETKSNEMKLFNII